MGRIVVALLLPEPQPRMLKDLVPKSKLDAYLREEPKESTGPTPRSRWITATYRAWGAQASRLLPLQTLFRDKHNVDIVFRELPISQCDHIPLVMRTDRRVRLAEQHRIQDYQQRGGHVVVLTAGMPVSNTVQSKEIEQTLLHTIARSKHVHAFDSDPFEHTAYRDGDDVVLQGRPGLSWSLQGPAGSTLQQARADASGRARLTAPDPDLNPFAHSVVAHYTDGALTIRRAWLVANLVGTLEREILTGDRANPGGAIALSIRTTESHNQAPVSGHDGTVSLAAGDEILGSTTYRTDANGMAHPRLLVPSNVTASTLTLRVDEAELAIDVIPELRLSVVVDRPLYKQTDKVHVRLMAHQAGDGRPVAGKDVELEMGSAKVQVTTSDHGIASHTFRLTDTAVGTKTLVARADKSEASYRFKVRAFERPTFTVQATPAVLRLEPGESVPIDVRATYVNGSPMINAAITSNSTWRFRIVTAPSRTDVDGLARFVIMAPTSYAKADLMFRVQDVDGRLGTARVAATSGDASDDVRVEALSDLAVGVPARFLVHGPADTQATVTFTPSDTRDVVFDAEGQVTLTATPNAVEQRVVVERAGHPTTHQDFLRIEQPTAKTLVMALDRRFARVQDTLTIELRGPDGLVALDVWNRDVPVLLTSAVLAGGATTVQVPLDATMVGAIRIHARHVDKPHVAVRNASVLVTRGRALDVRATSQRETYRPGETAQVDVSVRNAQGQPTAAVLGYWGVDAALLALAPAKAAFERVFDVGPRYTSLELLTMAVAIDRGAFVSRAKIDQLLDGKEECETARAFPYAHRRTQALATAAKSLHAKANLARSDRLRKVYLHAWQDVPLLTLQTAASFQELVAWHLAHNRLKASDLLDAWGTPFSIWSDRHNLELRLVSYGPDRRPSADDLEVMWGGSVLYEDLPERVRRFHDFVRANLKPRMSVTSGVSDDPMATDDRNFEVSDEFEVSEGIADAGLGRAFDGPANNATIGIAGSAGGAVFGRGGSSDGGTLTAGSPGHPAHIRRDFTPTLCFVPEAIVGPDGTTLSIPLKDSITTWRLRLVASDVDGAVGVGHGSIHVSQPLHASPWLAPHLTAGDVVTLPIALRNESGKPLIADIKVSIDGLLDVLGATTQSVEIAPDGTSRATFRLRARASGKATVRILTQADGAVDSQERIVTIHPDARTVVAAVNGSVNAHRSMSGSMPDPGTGDVRVDLYPSPITEALSGFDGMIRAPHG